MSISSNNGTISEAHHRGNKPLDIWERFQNPLARWPDVPGAGALMELRLADPTDPYLAELHGQVEQAQLSKAIASQDPAFWAAPPPKGGLPPLVPGRIPICTLHTGDTLSISVDDLPRGVLVVGPTGGGKTTWLAILLLSLLKVM